MYSNKSPFARSSVCSSRPRLAPKRANNDACVVVSICQLPKWAPCLSKAFKRLRACASRVRASGYICSHTSTAAKSLEQNSASSSTLSTVRIHPCLISWLAAENIHDQAPAYLGARLVATSGWCWKDIMHLLFDVQLNKKELESWKSEGKLTLMLWVISFKKELAIAASWWITVVRGMSLMLRCGYSRYSM